jgi:hypothetical protein
MFAILCFTACSKEQESEKEILKSSQNLDYDEVVSDLIQSGATVIPMEEMPHVVMAKSLSANASLYNTAVCSQLFNTSLGTSLLLGYTENTIEAARAKIKYTHKYRKVENDDGSVDIFCDGEGKDCVRDYDPANGSLFILVSEKVFKNTEK